MSILTRTPENPNFLQPNKFQLQFSRLSKMQYFCQTVTVPGISLSEVQRNTPFVDLYVPGEKAIFDTFNVTFIVDENLTAWREIYDWIRGMTFPTDFKEYRDLALLNKNTNLMSSVRNKPQPQYSDASLIMLSSANNPVYEFKLYDCFPISLSSFVVSSTDSPENVITADATFRYNYYDMIALN